MLREKETQRPNEGEPRSSGSAISLPKGGGAIRGIGEKFAANPVTGGGSMTVPIATSPSRSGFHPQLSLAYDSGAGNGPFGFGWNLSLPNISRKTDKGLPRYRDADESDVFILSGSEDLVPVLIESGGQWLRDTFSRTELGVGYRIQRYCPRIEGLFARIERWTNLESGETHWRSISPENITTIYGGNADSRIADPADPARAYSWLICESRDGKGNVIVYKYGRENADGVDDAQAHEKNRTALSRSANRYLKRIYYGNRVSHLLQPDLTQAVWMFEVVFDYGEHDQVNPKSTDAGAWLCRHDPFSSYRAGFEVRTYRLCQRVLMFHHFPGEKEVGQDCLVRSTDFVYRNIRDNADDLKKGHPAASFIASITHSGYQRKTGGGYTAKSLPAIEFQYSPDDIHEEVKEIDAESLANLPVGLDGAHYQWLDLDGDGVAGILTEQAGAWFYKRNLSPNHLVRANGEEHMAARFGPLELISVKPNATLVAGRAQFMDVAGDGDVDLVQYDGDLHGFYERSEDGVWGSFRPFHSWPNLDTHDPNVKFIDLDGDGHADILITEDEAFAWHASLAEKGFGPAAHVPKVVDEETGPRLVFADGTQSVYLADMCGDGLTDLVRIRNGAICYWPNLGYGLFGAKITMDHSPLFDRPEQFEQGRVRLGDIDGSGTADVLYLGVDGITVWRNQAGNRWSEPQKLKDLPHIDDVSSVTIVDLLGNGTGCIVWSSPLPGHARRPMHYIDLMGGQKPHLLIKTVNNLGAETIVHYAPSTKFYLQDKFAGTPWLTKLPFPVHVVERVETHDRVSRNCFVTRHAYHHGYFDGIEREFRGFGMVEQWDTAEFAALRKSDAFPSGVNREAASHVPPVLTKTWFHTGAFLDGSRISKHFEEEYYREGDSSENQPGLSDAQFEAVLLDDTILPIDIRHADGTRTPFTVSADEAREAVRALKGSILRQEIYAHDGTDAADRPYSVSERNYTIEFRQPRGDNRHAVFFAHARETIDFHYERKLYEIDGSKLADPRVSHTMTLAADEFGNVLQAATIGYGRRHDDAYSFPTDEDQTKQKLTLITFIENRFTNPIQEPDAYRAPRICETRSYEARKVTPHANEPRVTNLFGFDEMVSKLQALSDGHLELSYEHWDVAGASLRAPTRRLIEMERHLYYQDELSGPLPLGQQASHGLPYETYKLAFTPELLADTFQRDQENLLPDAVGVLRDVGGYVRSDDFKVRAWFPSSDVDGCWWVPSGQTIFSPVTKDPPPPKPPEPLSQDLNFARRHYFMPQGTRDPFGALTRVRYDAHDLLLIESEDAAENTVQATNDYRVLQPTLVTDPNDNRTEVKFDALGLVAATAVRGKQGEGDALDGVVPNLTRQQLDHFYADPKNAAVSLLGSASTRIVYDLERYRNDSNQPTYAATLARETHASEPLPSGGLKIQVSFSYSDGFGREIQKKIQAEPGKVEVEDAAGNRFEVETTPRVRWVGSGWTIFNNKGKPVRQYEPFFSVNHAFQFAKTVGVSSVVFYDPLERVVATLHPNNTYEKVVFDPWRQETWDVNDTVLQADPRLDPHVGDFFKRVLGAGNYLSWHEQRKNGQLGWDLQDQQTEKFAAHKAAQHAETPTVACFDTLGRTFLTIRANGPAPTDQYATTVDLDIEGNPRAEIDAKGRVVMRFDYNMLGTPIKQASMEAGARWMLNDVTGKVLRVWDSRNRRIRHEYDELRRPVRLFVGVGDGVEKLAERTVYGEKHRDAEAQNLRGKIFMQFDGAGVVLNESYDFKGNLLLSQRQLVLQYHELLDWSNIEPLLAVAAPELLDVDAIKAALAPLLEADTWKRNTTYDALNRPVTHTAPDHTVIRPEYNEANLLERVTANLRGADTLATFVDDIDYNAKGQREFVRYGNNTETTYSYDPLTFRLRQLITERSEFGRAERIVQNVRYTYDPVGNITHIQDDADIHNVVYFRNRRVEPSADYTYDAIYRLIEANGREHLAQAAASTNHTDAPRVELPHPGDGKALGIYLEKYVYDEVGNILEMIHQGVDPTNPGWTRTYTYIDPSLLQMGKANNRLTRTQIGSGPLEPYAHDEHGNMTTMPHLAALEWDFKDQLHVTQRQVVNPANGPGERTYYVYDATGQRVRKVTEHASRNGDPPRKKNERLYLGGFEVYREYEDGDVTVERETLHIMDDKQRIALVETKTVHAGTPTRTPTPLVRYQFSNHLGSAALELDERGEVISYEEYYPYGSTSYQAVRNDIEVAPKRYRYSGKERDEESGFYYYGARYYPPWLARWTSTDPSGMVDGANLYAFVAGNPLQRIDPTGRNWEAALADSRMRRAEEQIQHTKLGTLEQQAALQEHHAASQAKEDAELTSWAHREIGFNLVLQGAETAALAPVAAVSMPVRALLAGASGFGLGEAIQGETTTFHPVDAVFSDKPAVETTPIKGKDRFWHGVAAALGIVASAAGEANASPGRSNPRFERPWAKGGNGKTYEQTQGKPMFMDPSEAPKEIGRRDKLVKKWAKDAGLDPSKASYRDPSTQATGGGATYPSGEIVLDKSAFSGGGSKGDRNARKIFGHEAGHALAGHHLRFEGRGINTPVWAERAASKIGARIFPDMAAELEADAVRRAWYTRKGLSSGQPK